MRILIITGSPHERGSTQIIADSFAEGARESGHTVEFFNAGKEDISPCLGCGRCFKDGRCFRRDGFDRLSEMIMDADAVVFATPLYYFNMTAQMKTAIDRFYPLGPGFGKGKKTALLEVQYNPDPAIAQGLIWNMRSIAGYVGMDYAGELIATGCGSPDATASSGFVEKAFEFGKGF